MMISSGTDVSVGALRKYCRRTSRLGLFVLSAFFACAAGAEEPISAEEIAVDTTPVSLEEQRADLRRALASDFDSDVVRERRKLSREEREALHRDLRDAMRHVNADYEAGERKRR